MLFKLLFFTAVMIGAKANAEHSTFFANIDLQRMAPKAFALQPESFDFVHRFAGITLRERQDLAQAILANVEIKQAIAKWNELSIKEQIPFLKMIFDLEVQILGINPPELVIEDGITAGPAFFDFDPKNPTPGKVLLNPIALAKEKSKYASLSLLLHETRHSYQFQLGYKLLSPIAMKSEDLKIFERYRTSFEAQKQIDQMSFCDFLTLLNEYEAFHFGNDVLRRLTNGEVDLVEMGTFASQFHNNGDLKIDLAKLIDDSLAQNKSVLDEFNLLEQAQLQQLKTGRILVR